MCCGPQRDVLFVDTQVIIQALVTFGFLPTVALDLNVGYRTNNSVNID